MATVYLAEDLKHRRQVAIKVLRPELAASLGVDRFVREIEIAANLTHPHILPLFDSGEADGFLYYVMPFIDGESLRDRLAREQKLSVPDAEAHEARGLIAQRRFDTPASVRHVLRAVELDPGNATAAWAAGFVLAEVGRTDEAREFGDRARNLDPLYWPAQAGSCVADLFDGDFDSALTKAEAMHTISGDNPAANAWLGICLLYAGRSSEAAQLFDRVAAAGAGVFSASGAFLSAMVKEDREVVRAVLAEAATREAVEIDKEVSWMAAAASASVGDTDEALFWLSHAIEMGFINHRLFAEVDPFLASLRGDPRFEALMERALEKQREVEAEA